MSGAAAVSQAAEAPGEMLELHTLGVDDGYTQDDVVEVARTFTGWTIDLRAGGFVCRADLHDADSKVVLGQKIAGTGLMSDGEHVLDLLARHPSTARFISEITGTPTAPSSSA
jgi:uncharacterized protein (DUF1800 family)